LRAIPVALHGGIRTVTYGSAQVASLPSCQQDKKQAPCRNAPVPFDQPQWA
jgi:hypothetical protein